MGFNMNKRRFQKYINVLNIHKKQVLIQYYQPLIITSILAPIPLKRRRVILGVHLHAKKFMFFILKYLIDHAV